MTLANLARQSMPEELHEILAKKAAHWECSGELKPENHLSTTF